MSLRLWVSADRLLVLIALKLLEGLTAALPQPKGTVEALVPGVGVSAVGRARPSNAQAAPALLRRAATFHEEVNHEQAVQGGRISCGGHAAITCADCPDWGGYNTDHGAQWCNGDCKWDNENSKCIWKGVQNQELSGLKNPNMTAWDNETVRKAANAAVAERAHEADERLRLEHEEEERARDVGMTRKLHIFVIWSVGSGVCAVLTAFGTVVYFLFGKPKVKMAYVPPKRKAKDTYTIVIKKTLGAKLGLDITLKVDTMLINKITGGLAKEWNQKYPKLQIKPGDEVVQVNDVRGEGGKGKRLLEECAKNKELTIRLVRYMKEEEESEDEKDDKPQAEEEQEEEGADEEQDKSKGEEEGEKGEQEGEEAEEKAEEKEPEEAEGETGEQEGEQAEENAEEKQAEEAEEADTTGERAEEEEPKEAEEPGTTGAPIS